MSAVTETPTKVGGLISGDVVAEAMQQLVTAGRLNAAQANAILDFATEARKRRLSMAQMAEVLEVSTTTVSRVLRGIYEGDWKGVTQRAKTAVQLWEARAPFAKPLFVETSLAAKVQAACDFALTRQVPVILTGLSQQGKTTALKRYAERSEATVRLVRVPAATSLKEFLAEMAEACAIPVTFTCEGATLTPSADGTSCKAHAQTEGLYRIFATDAQERTRDAYLNIRTKTTTESSEQAYLADVEGSARKAVNDQMAAVLAARDRSNTVAVGQTSTVAACDKAFNGTTPLSTAPLAPQYFCMVEPKTSWGPDAVAVAPHFAVTAAHWQPSATKTATFVTPSGASTTVSGTAGTSLTAWARANGYSESEIDEADIDDIYVWHFSSGTIPDACIPYVMDLKARETYYDGDLSGIICYTVTQNGYLSYAPITHADGDRFTFGSFAPTTTRADMLSSLAPACCATIYGGDSGRPILMIHEQKPVLLSTFWSAGSGPSFVRACDILDAYIHQQSGGAEALKRIE